MTPTAAPAPTAALVPSTGAIEPELTPFEVIERVISTGDLSAMAPQDRVAFYWRTCESLGLNPLTRPFDFIRSKEGGIVMYAKRDATDQLRDIRKVSVTSIERAHDETLGLYTVTVRGRLPDGREDESSGVVNVKGLGGEYLANALMKAETKGKRRMTLSLVGLGFLDETEISAAGAPIHFDPETGDLIEPATSTAPLSLAETVRAQTEKMKGAIDAQKEAETAKVEPIDGQKVDTGTGEIVEPVADPKPSRRRAKPAPEADEAPILAAPMTAAESTRRPLDDDPDAIAEAEWRAGAIEVVDDALANAQAEPDAEGRPAPEPARVEPPAAPAPAPQQTVSPLRQKPDDRSGLNIQQLADLARAAGLGKMRFASALEVVPADVGKAIEEMDDRQRLELAIDLGLVEPNDG